MLLKVTSKIRYIEEKKFIQLKVKWTINCYLLLESLIIIVSISKMAPALKSNLCKLYLYKYSRAGTVKYVSVTVYKMVTLNNAIYTICLLGSLHHLSIVLANHRWVGNRHKTLEKCIHDSSNYETNKGHQAVNAKCLPAEFILKLQFNWSLVVIFTRWKLQRFSLWNHKGL